MSTITCTGFAFIFAQLTCTIPDPPAPAVICPPVRAWTRDFRDQVAKEMRAAPNSAMARAVTESIGDRAVARACKGAPARRVPAQAVPTS